MIAGLANGFPDGRLYAIIGRQRGEEPGGDDLRLGQPVGDGGQQGAA